MEIQTLKGYDDDDCLCNEPVTREPLCFVICSCCVCYTKCRVRVGGMVFFVLHKLLQPSSRSRFPLASESGW